MNTARVSQGGEAPPLCGRRWLAGGKRCDVRSGNATLLRAEYQRHYTVVGRLLQDTGVPNGCPGPPLVPAGIDTNSSPQKFQVGAVSISFRGQQDLLQLHLSLELENVAALESTVEKFRQL